MYAVTFSVMHRVAMPLPSLIKATVNSRGYIAVLSGIDYTIGARHALPL
jgi:hypothetical protein